MKALLKGVYFLFDGEECVYVGSSSDIWRRISEHFRGIGHGKRKKFDSFEIIEEEKQKTREYIEKVAIQEIRPKYNEVKYYTSCIGCRGIKIKRIDAVNMVHNLLESRGIN